MPTDSTVTVDVTDGSSESPTWLTVAEAAAHARCHPETIRRAYHAGNLRMHRFGTRGVRIVLTELDWWLDNGAKAA
jgi:excisionase family DNA binding protein